ncbi:MAG TPA: hypothetical protein PLZ51_17140, partial [Aggregatilineales bacterium]|nr:hypothetical protein [Aggregatilineales bacterium]
MTQDWLKKYAQKQLDALKLTPDFLAQEFEWRVEKGIHTADAYMSADRRGRTKSLTRADREVVNQIWEQ